MQKITLVCDTCGCPDKVEAYRIDNGSEMDPSGNGYNTIWIYKDFCPECLVKAITKFGVRNVKPYSR